MPTTKDINGTIVWSADTTGDCSYTCTTTTAPNLATSTYYTPIQLGFINTNEEKIKEYTEKTDKHIDELESDIEYLNKQRAEQEIKITSLQLETNKLKDTVEELGNKIRFLETYTRYLEDKIITMEDKTSE